MPNPDSIMRKVTDALDLPSEATMNLPRIVMAGNTSLLIENHAGIIEYSDKLVRVRTSIAEVRVHGNGFMLEELASEQILISGEIFAVQWQETQ